MDEICRLNALLGEVEHPIDPNRHDEKPKNRVFDIHHPTMGARALVNFDTEISTCGARFRQRLLEAQRKIE